MAIDYLTARARQPLIGLEGRADTRPGHQAHQAQLSLVALPALRSTGGLVDFGDVLLAPRDDHPARAVLAGGVVIVVAHDEATQVGHFDALARDLLANLLRDVGQHRLKVEITVRDV